MLLTSSQVSVAVSSGVVVLCTSALFFSGYVIQQRTLHDLRRAIKEPPPEPPKIFLPDRFKKMTTELEDGTVVTIDETRMEAGNGGDENSMASKGEAAQSPVEIQVQPSMPPAAEFEQAQKEKEEKLQQILLEEQEARDSSVVILGSSSALRDKVRRTEKKEKTKPVSRAERRRLIKEELRRLSHYDKPILYQRRLY